MRSADLQLDVDDDVCCIVFMCSSNDGGAPRDGKWWKELVSLLAQGDELIRLVSANEEPLRTHE
jgi:hypothetical protein